MEKNNRLNISLRIRWPQDTGQRYPTGFFIGVYHPHARVSVEYEGPSPGIDELVSINGTNWFLASDASPLHGNRPGLVHQSTGGHALAFRGYVLSPPIHSYSPGDVILRYWSKHLQGEHNGAFSVAYIDDMEKSLTLMTDAFGMGPLYYRRLSEAVIFATNPRFLVAENDPQDMLAWRCLLQTEFISSDRSLSIPVRRVPAGGFIRFSSEKQEAGYWFDFCSMPPGTKPVDGRSTREVEGVFQDALTRCLNLSNDNVILPLSSGYDSRRFLASFLDRGVEFAALTAKVFQKEYRDLDSRFAAEMARDFGFRHAVIEPAGIAEHVVDDRIRRDLVDAETGMHTWVIRLMRSLPQKPCILFDGIAGDILGNPGFRIRGLYDSFEKDLDIVSDYCVNDHFEHILENKAWPSAVDLKKDIKKYLNLFQGRRNVAEIAFILLRQRRSIAPWTQQLMPSGHIVVCPYLDLEYVRKMLEYRPEEKHQVVFQKECLKQFWPDLYKYRGNRNIPESIPPGDPAGEHERQIACFHKLRSEINSEAGSAFFSSHLKFKARVVFAAASRFDIVAIRSQWYLKTIMELVSRDLRKKTCLLHG